MHSDQSPYRELHDAMLERKPFTSAALSSWLERHGSEATWLAEFRARSGPRTPASEEELWRLYGVSRIIEMLNLSFQSGEADGSAWPGPCISRKDVWGFATALGLTPCVPAVYTPFDCEIVRVIEAPDRDHPAALVEVAWPCFMLGELLIGRAGATVRAGSARVTGEIAMSSTMYWAYRRKHRPYRDLSHGWGHNSQWRTTFRRDYRVGQQCHLNVDGKNDLATREPPADENSGMTLAERVEMVINRCFIQSTTNSEDLWPWDDRLEMAG